MSYFSRNLILLLGLLALCVTFSGCMADRPDNREMPWSTPSSWEGTMPLPGGIGSQY